MSIRLCSDGRERWKPIEGFPGYFVSNSGRIAAVHVLKTKRRSKRHAHQRVRLVRDGVSFEKELGRVILEAFVGPAPAGTVACHFDDIATNNVLGNLRWGTRKDNVHDAIRNGRWPVGARHRSARLSAEQVRGVRRLLASGQSQRSIAKQLGVSRGAIQSIRTRRSWADLTDD